MIYNYSTSPYCEKTPTVNFQDLTPSNLNIEEFAEKAASIGYEALNGKDGIAKDSLIYASSIIYSVVRSVNFSDSAKLIRKSIDSGKAKEFFSNAI